MKMPPWARTVLRSVDTAAVREEARKARAWSKARHAPQSDREAWAAIADAFDARASELERKESNA